MGKSGRHVLRVLWYVPFFFSVADHSDFNLSLWFFLIGIIIEGCPSSVKIDNCLTLQETNDPTKMLDNGAPKQRIEFYEGKVKGTFFWYQSFDMEKYG